MVVRLAGGVSVLGLIAAAVVAMAAAPSTQPAAQLGRVAPSTRPATRPTAPQWARPATRPAVTMPKRPTTMPATRPALTVAPPFAEPTASGKAVTFPKEYAGKLVLIDFWATWCPFCRKELAFWKGAYDRYHGSGLEIIGVPTDKNRKMTLDKFQTFVAQNDLKWEQVFDNGPQLSQLYQVASLPTSFLVDGSTGAILAQGRAIRGEALARQIELYLPKVKPDATSKPAP